MFEYQPSTAARAAVFRLAMARASAVADGAALAGGVPGIGRRMHSLPRALNLKPDT